MDSMTLEPRGHTQVVRLIRSCAHIVHDTFTSGIESQSNSTVLFKLPELESILQQMRAAFHKVVTIILFRGERHGRLLIRFRCTLPTFEVVSGVLGMELVPKGAADALHEAAKAAIRKFCTTNFAAPSLRGFRGEKSSIDEALESVPFKFKLNVVVTDSAPNELLAQDIARGRCTGIFANEGAAQDSEPYFPKERPWKSDKTLDSKRAGEPQKGFTCGQ